MTNYSKLPAILVLEDGTVYHGKAAGKIGTTTGEICFNTGITGYQEIFTDLIFRTNYGNNQCPYW